MTHLMYKSSKGICTKDGPDLLFWLDIRSGIYIMAKSKGERAGGGVKGRVG